MMPAPERRTALKTWRAWLPRAGILGLLTILIVAHRPLLTRFAYLFRAEDPAPSDAMLLLAFEEEPLELYRRGWAPRILLISNEPIPFPDLNPLEVSRQRLSRVGIPLTSVRVLPPVSLGADYREIAHHLREDLLRHPIRKIMIAVYVQQSARVGRIFRGVLSDTGVDVRVVAVSNPGFNESNWYRFDEGLIAYFSELIEVIREPFH